MWMFAKTCLLSSCFWNGAGERSMGWECPSSGSTGKNPPLNLLVPLWLWCNSPYPTSWQHIKVDWTHAFSWQRKIIGVHHLGLSMQAVPAKNTQRADLVSWDGAEVELGPAHTWTKGCHPSWTFLLTLPPDVKEKRWKPQKSWRTSLSVSKRSLSS